MENIMSLKRQLFRVEIRKDENTELFKRKRQLILEYNQSQDKTKFLIKNIQSRIQNFKYNDTFNQNQYNQLLSMIHQIQTISSQYLTEQILNFLVNISLIILENNQSSNNLRFQIIKSLNQIFIEFLFLEDQIVINHLQKFKKICQYQQFQNLFFNISAIRQWNNEYLRKVYIQIFLARIESKQTINFTLSEVIHNFLTNGPINSVLNFRFINYINGIMGLNINKTLQPKILTKLFDILKILSNTIHSALNIVKCAYIIKESLQLLNEYKQDNLILPILKLYASLFLYDEAVEITLKYYPTFILITRKFLKSSNSQILKVICTVFCNLATSKFSHQYIFNMLNQFILMSKNSMHDKIRQESAIVVLNYLHQSKLQYKIAFLKQNHIEFLINLLTSESYTILWRTLWVIRMLLQSQLLVNNKQRKIRQGQIHPEEMNNLSQQINYIQNFIEDNLQMIKLIEQATKSKNEKIASFAQELLLQFFHKQQNSARRMLNQI